MKECNCKHKVSEGTERKRKEAREKRIQVTLVMVMLRKVGQKGLFGRLKLISQGKYRKQKHREQRLPKGMK